MSEKKFNSIFTALLILGLTSLGAATPSEAQNQQVQNETYADAQPTFEPQEIVDAGHQFFGQTTVGLASLVEYVFAEKGQPVGYIVGEEASGAIIGGLRYGEGELRMKTGERQKVFWQGPTLGFDLGADGSRTMVLVYKMDFPNQIYDSFTSTSGLAYIAGGLGVNFQSNQSEMVLAVIRTGVGLRLGINIGYIKYTPESTWNPF